MKLFRLKNLKNMITTIMDFLSPPERTVGVSLSGLLTSFIIPVEVMQYVVLTLTSVATILGIVLQIQKQIDRWHRHHPKGEEDEPDDLINNLKKKSND